MRREGLHAKAGVEGLPSRGPRCAEKIVHTNVLAATRAPHPLIILSLLLLDAEEPLRVSHAAEVHLALVGERELALFGEQGRRVGANVEKGRRGEEDEEDGLTGNHLGRRATFALGDRSTSRPRGFPLSPTRPFVRSQPRDRRYSMLPRTGRTAKKKKKKLEISEISRAEFDLESY